MKNIRIERVVSHNYFDKQLYIGTITRHGRAWTVSMFFDCPELESLTFTSRKAAESVMLDIWNAYGQSTKGYDRFILIANKVIAELDQSKSANDEGPIHMNDHLEQKFGQITGRISKKVRLNM
jgi:hypothetical protein